MHFAQIANVGTVPFSIVPSFPSDSDKSTAQTVGLMHQIIRESSAAAAVIAATRDALRLVPMSAPVWRKAQAIWEWVHGAIRFRSDESSLTEDYRLPEDYELLQRPELLLATRRGDCDDFTMLACSMLLCAGVPYGIVTIAADPESPQRFSHVYGLALQESGAAIPMDCSHGRYFGWEAPRAFRRVEWPA